ncbi:alpha/beta fold hydrolase [Pseudonocardia sp. EC080610-09]|uniref:alpha/beta fold hydrolase n=1 Tax=Pseudonocardia sp. EC080610-09 TaxID=1688404 RepID=UPI00076106A6|nr:alpha/beta hydrolase [Pseudonocardia sp. EC080610-09]
MLDRHLPLADRRIVGTSLGPTHLTSVGEGPRVLLVPGTNFSAASSIGLVTALAGTHRVTVADLPGQPGLSSAERCGDDLVRRHRCWFAEVHAHLAEEPMIVVGESLGAAVVLCADPDPRIAGLVLVVPAGLVAARVDPGVLAAATGWTLRRTERWSDRLLHTMDGGATVPDRARLIEWMTLVARHARTSLAPVPLPASVLTRWRSTPCRVLAGPGDRFFPAGRLVVPARRMRDAETIRVDGTGHLLTHTAPRAVAGDCPEFA